MKLAEDLGVFFNEFATTATLDDGTSLEVIFDLKYSEFLEGSEGREVTALIPTARLGAISEGTNLETNDRQYEVLSIQPQDDGRLTQLLLKEIN